MNAIFKDVLDRIEHLPLETQRMLARELGRRAREYDADSGPNFDEYRPGPSSAEDIYRELAARYRR